MATTWCWCFETAIVGPSLFLSMQLYWDFKLYCFYFFTNSAFPNSCWVQLIKDAAYTRMFTVFQTSHQPVLLFSQQHEQTGPGSVMFLWEISNTSRQAKFKNHFLLATRSFNSNCIWSCLFLPSLIAHARKISSSFPQFVFPALLSAISESNNR